MPDRRPPLVPVGRLLVGTRERGDGRLHEVAATDLAKVARGRVDQAAVTMNARCDTDDDITPLIAS
jgi:hypothetical protein